MIIVHNKIKFNRDIKLCLLNNNQYAQHFIKIKRHNRTNKSELIILATMLCVIYFHM